MIKRLFFVLCVFIYCGDGLAQDYEKWYYIEPFGLGLGLPNYLELNFLRGDFNG